MKVCFNLLFRNSSHKGRSEAAISKVHSQKKLDSYIHHVVSNRLPPTAQVGGAVIKSPRLPLPPIPVPNTAPPFITIPSKKTIPRINTDKIKTADASQRGTHEGLGDIDITRVGTTALHEHTNEEPVDINSPLQSDSNISVGSNEVIETDDHDISNNNVNVDVADAAALSTSVENLTSPVRTTDNVSISPPETDSDNIKLLKSSVVARSPKKPLKHKKKVLSGTLSSPPLPNSSNKIDNSDHMATAAAVLHSDIDDKLLPALKKKLPSNFDVITSLTGHKRYIVYSCIGHYLWLYIAMQLYVVDHLLWLLCAGCIIATAIFSM